MTEPAFFTQTEGEYTPHEISRGPWDPESMHGRVIAGLLAHEMEARFGDPAFQAARLTVDMFRLPRLEPVSVVTRPIREGNRIRVVEGICHQGDTEVARATAVLLRRAQQPEGNVWRPAPWQVPAPESIEPQQPRGFPPMWETRVIDHGFGSVAQKRVWLREIRPLIAGIELTPFVRAAVAADFTNPLANSGDQGLQFVNADITLYLQRDPDGEFIGFEVTSHQSEQGVAVAECLLYDARGAIGHSLVCGVANQRRS